MADLSPIGPMLQLSQTTALGGKQKFAASARALQKLCKRFPHLKPWAEATRSDRPEYAPFQRGAGTTILSVNSISIGKVSYRAAHVLGLSLLAFDKFSQNGASRVSFKKL